MACHAGEAVGIEGAVHLRILRQASGQNADGIVAAIAVTREFNPFRPEQYVHAGAIERSAKRIRVQRLTPLAVSFLMTTAAVFGLGEGAGLDEIVAFDGGVPGGGQLARSEMEVVGTSDFVRVLLAIGLRGQTADAYRDRYE